MLTWRLDRTVATSAGRVAAGAAGDGPPPMLAHGWPWSSHARSRLIPAPAQRVGVALERLEGLGHLLQLEAPARVAARLRAALA